MHVTVNRVSAGHVPVHVAALASAMIHVPAAIAVMQTQLLNRAEYKRGFGGISKSQGVDKCSCVDTLPLNVLQGYGLIAFSKAYAVGVGK